MAVDATGPTSTPDNIPTYNTANDIPSGKGLNAIVAAIQAALSLRINKPSGGAAGDVPVWNGSAFVWPSGSRDGTKFLRDDGSWANAANSLDKTGTPVTVGPSSTTLASVYSFTVPSNTLTAHGVLRLRMNGKFFQNTGGIANFRAQILWGTTVVIDDDFSVANDSTNGRAFRLEVDVSNLGATNSQEVQARAMLVTSAVAAAGAGLGNFDSNVNGGFMRSATDPAKDTTASQVLEVKLAPLTSHASMSITKLHAILDVA